MERPRGFFEWSGVIVAALLWLGGAVLFLCLIGLALGGFWKAITCPTGGDC